MDVDNSSQQKNEEKDEKQQFLSLDDLLVRYGQFGAYQRRIVFVVCFVAFSTAFNNLGYVFWAARPDYHCSPSPNPGHLAAVSEESFLNLTVPWENDGHGGLRRSRCFQYVRSSEADGELTAPREGYSWNDSLALGRLQFSNDRNVTECSSWKFETKQYKSTIVSEWNLVCSKAWLKSLTQSTYMGGRIFGALFYGHVSDRYGRRIALMSSIFGQLICSFGSCWVPDIYLFLGIRFLLGIQTTGEFQTAYVIVTEMVGPNWRVFTGTLIEIYWAFGYMTIASIAYFLRDRFHFQLALSVPLCLLVVLYWIVPETPRWLLARGRRRECKELLDKILEDSAMLKDGGEDYMSQLKLTDATDSVRYTLFDLFRTPNIRRTTCILLFTWFVNSFVFYGLSLASSSLGGNDYLTFFLAGLVEIPAYVILIVTFTWLGRPIPFTVAMLIAGVSLISILFVPQDLTGVIVTLAMIGKAAITCSYAMVYLYSSEIYPTVMRSTGVGAGTCFARIGGVVAPLVEELRYRWSALPSLIFGGVALAAGAMVVFLPETKDRPMPQTVCDGEKLNEFRCPCQKTNGRRTSRKIDLQCLGSPATETLNV